jgi:RNA polymerase sigma-70 factor (ECF subfamily)
VAVVASAMSRFRLESDWTSACCTRIRPTDNRANPAAPLNNSAAARNLSIEADDCVELYEQLLVIRCQTGDDAAFTELVARYGPRLRYYLRKMGDRPEDVEDRLQDIWFDVVRGVGRLADPQAFPAWLYRIARARTALARRQARPPALPLADTEVGDEVSSEEFSDEDAARVHAALNDLMPEHREVLVLRFLEGMSYEDIARIVGDPLGTVKSRIHYAKRALRATLERTNVHE